MNDGLTRHTNRKGPLRTERSLSKTEHRQYEKKLIQMRREGCTRYEIAEALNLTVKVVDGWIRGLVGEGKIKPKRSTAVWRDLNSKLVQTIIRMRKQRAPFAEIGAKIGVTREWIRQVVKRIIMIHGEAILEFNQWTIGEIAKIVKLSPSTIRALCSRGTIPCHRRGTSQKGTYLVDNEGLEALRLYRCARHTRCVICQRYLAVNPQSRPLTCSEKCRKKYLIRHRAALIEQGPNRDTLRGWVKELWLKLKGHAIAANEKWLTLTKASQQTGLSKMQLRWLNERAIVATRPHPIKRWRGKPVRMYAASEIRIAKQVYTAALREQKKKGQ